MTLDWGRVDSDVLSVRQHLGGGAALDFETVEIKGSEKSVYLFPHGARRGRYLTTARNVGCGLAALLVFCPHAQLVTSRSAGAVAGPSVAFLPCAKVNAGRQRPGHHTASDNPNRLSRLWLPSPGLATGGAPR
jgi:hypothetical protein